MNPIQYIFDSVGRHFKEGGRFARLYPFFESIESIFWGTSDTTQKGPHVRDSLDVKRFMALVLVALAPHFCFAIYNTGYQANLAAGLPLGFWPVVLKGARFVLPIVIVTYGVGFFWEVLFAVVRKHAISEGLFVTCMLFPLTLPPTIPLWQVALGISFGIVIGKEIFGGTGRNFLNPALTGRAFLFFAYPAQMTGERVWVALSNAPDAISTATPLSVIALTERTAQLGPALQKAGYSVGKLFLGLYPGSIGATSTFLCLLGAAFLVLIGIASFRVIVGGVLGILVTGFFLKFFAGPAASPWLALNPVYHLLMGGAAFGLAYMATDPVSSPDMKTAKWVYGFTIGMLTVFIRVFNPAFVEGVMLAILFMNLFAPLLDTIAIKARLKKRIPNV